ncbi:MAG: glycosyltransferase [Pseudomonadota bacterium]|nr:glycosyltransferase [Pseudomonadota bacterium]
MDQKDPRDIARALREVYRGDLIATGERLVRLKAKYVWEVQARKLIELHASLLTESKESRDSRWTVCHITTVHRLGDTRIFHREAAAISEDGKYSLIIIASGRSLDVPAGIPGEIRLLPARGGRLQRMVLSQGRAIVMALGAKADLYHLHDPELLPCAILLRWLGKRVVFDVHEDLPKQILIKPWIPRRFVRIGYWFARLFDALVSRFSDGIVAATPQIGRKYHGIPVAVVQNFPMMKEFSCPVSLPLSQRGNVAIYVGTITEERGLRCLLQAAERAAERLKGNFRLKLAGPFASDRDRALFEALANKDIVEHVGWQDRRQVADLLGQAVVGLVTFLPADSHLEAYPNKLFEYGAAGIPAIASHFPLWRRLMDGGCVFVDPTEPQAIADALCDLMTDKFEAEAIGRQAQERVRTRYCWESEAEKLLGLYEQLLGSGAPGELRSRSSRHAPR